MKIEKIIQKMLQMPKEMPYKDIVKVLEYEGWEMKRTGATSHFTFKKSGAAKIITLSVHGSNDKIKASYIRNIVQILELEEKYGKK